MNYQGDLYLDENPCLNECLAPPVGRDPDCDHESDPVERALYIVVDNILKHVLQGKPWDCQDACWQIDLAKARAILHEWAGK